MLLEELKGSDIFEDSETECKARLDRENIIGWLKSVVGFATSLLDLREKKRITKETSLIMR